MTVGGFNGPIPSGLDWLRSSEDGRAWLDGLPRAADEVAAHWGLRLGEPFPYAFTSLAIRALREDGTAVVLKMRHLDRETEHEALALRAWDGDGAVRLLDEYPAQDALLLEMCAPGTPLPPELAISVLEKLLPRLWKPVGAPPFRSLADESTWWHANLLLRPPGRARDAALEALSTLPGTQGEPVLLHQDLHGANVLAAQREPWLVIDPKPLVGEREFGLAPIIRSQELGPGKRETLRRLDRLTAELGLDRERARMWCVAQTMAWSDDGTPDHAEIAEWLLDG